MRKTANPRKKPAPAGPSPIELFSTSSGVRAVQSPPHTEILNLLRSRELPFDEIVRLSGKAKSTVSVHLKTMEEEGIVGSKGDPGDSRRKIFFIRSPCVGNLSQGLALQDEDAGEPVAGGDPFAFYRYMFRTIRVSLLSEGINIDPVLQNAGYRVGQHLYPDIADADIAGLLVNLQKFWTESNLGTIEVESLSPLVIRVYDCFECGDLPELGRPACAFDAGILRAVFSRHFAADCSVEETTCYAMGSDHCRFLIAPKESEQAVTEK
ncbi:ArsR family transcriptional regulator [Methanoculleus sp. FWC-SCC1]|uniref:ArsR family transcriptional regulator n=1 Tax=Methanoculleus frigidifontis TaxID=2584085 RepID=A0ABT8M6Y3_9EURY|nr:V4R domain-containing protein [Methanoculleus sp. FWC-SCC1]MDN7023688.1 ArsR family transcriptional regulator [Methanoculleus sp. FWC-SCC1]